MKRTLPGEIWWVDFGLAAKIRPALIPIDYPADDELALLVVIPHTTALRDNRWELAIPKPFLKPAHFTSSKSNRSRLCASILGSEC